MSVSFFVLCGSLAVPYQSFCSVTKWRNMLCLFLILFLFVFASHNQILWYIYSLAQVLTFKEINWQSLRIEADAIESDDQDLGSTPLRLITNQGRIRIALKRRVRLFLPFIYYSVYGISHKHELI